MIVTIRGWSALGGLFRFPFQFLFLFSIPVPSLSGSHAKRSTPCTTTAALHVGDNPVVYRGRKIEPRAPDLLPKSWHIKSCRSCKGRSALLCTEGNQVPGTSRWPAPSMLGPVPAQDDRLVCVKGGLSACQVLSGPVRSCQVSYRPQTYMSNHVASRSVGRRPPSS